MELKECDLRFCTFHYAGRCCNKKRENCPYAKVMDADFLRKDMNIPAEEPRTEESRE